MFRRSKVLPLKDYVNSETLILITSNTCLNNSVQPSLWHCRSIHHFSADWNIWRIWLNIYWMDFRQMLYTHLCRPQEDPLRHIIWWSPDFPSSAIIITQNLLLSTLVKNKQTKPETLLSGWGLVHTYNGYFCKQGFLIVLKKSSQG